MSLQTVSCVPMTKRFHESDVYPLPPSIRDLFLPDSLEILSTVIAAQFDTVDNVLTAIRDKELCGEVSERESSVSNLNVRGVPRI